MDTRTGEIGEFKDLMKKALDPKDVVPLGNRPDPNCPKCQGTGRGRRDPETLRWAPCTCTGAAVKHSAAFERMRKPAGKR